MSLWGTKEYDEITAEFGERTNIVPFEKIYDESEDCLGQNGVDGFTITVDRVFYKDGEEVEREPITTRYKPAPDVTCGPKPDKKPGTRSPTTGDQPAGAEGDAAERRRRPGARRRATHPPGTTSSRTSSARIHGGAASRRRGCVSCARWMIPVLD